MVTEIMGRRLTGKGPRNGEGRARGWAEEGGGLQGQPQEKGGLLRLRCWDELQSCPWLRKGAARVNPRAATECGGGHNFQPGVPLHPGEISGGTLGSARPGANSRGLQD